MVNYLLIAVGQCGNQLSYELMNMIYDHCIQNHQLYLEQQQKPQKHVASSKQQNKRGYSSPSPNSSIAQKGQKGNDSKKSFRSRPYYNYDDSESLEDPSQQMLFDSLFRLDNSSYSSSCPDTAINKEIMKSTLCTARIICLDTEPKVIDSCLEKAKSHYYTQSFYSWHYDTKNIAYRHSGAGNNWALGYAMTTGDFLEMSINCIRREIERCDDVPVLIYIHSLAGGTGSGLGTHLVESSYELFSNCYHYHILISPHSFSEVIVQYYNTLLCLSKIYSNTNGILIFDNENAQLLCKHMKFIEKPKLQDLNQTISNHLLTLFLPKRKSFVTVDPYFVSSSYSHLYDDLSFLCSNPYYRFFMIKLTPQTSIDSIDFTYDSWFSLINTVQRMQLSGSLSERNITPLAKQLGRSTDGVYPSSSYRFSSTSERGMKSTKSGSEDRDESGGLPVIAEEVNHLAGDDTLEHFYPDTLFGEHNKTDSSFFLGASSLIKSVASIISLHGEGSREAVDCLHESLHEDSTFSKDMISSESRTNQSYSTNYYTTRGSTTLSKVSSANYHQTKPKLFEEYLQSHAAYLHTTSVNTSSPIQFYSTNFFLNQYQRSSTVLSNDQSILPLLHRTVKRSAEMFQVKAYVHQYLSHGLEEQDFIDSFQTLGSIIKCYSDL